MPAASRAVCVAALTWSATLTQDRVALPWDTADGDDKKRCEVQCLWYGVDGKEHSPQLAGALTGQARLDYWEAQRAFVITKEAEGGDGDGDGSGEVDDDV